jgi:prophage antirepressor-like protein
MDTPQIEKFTLNGIEVRFIAIDNDVWFVTSDANKAFGFEGETTALDKVSVRVDRLPIHE